MRHCAPTHTDVEADWEGVTAIARIVGIADLCCGHHYHARARLDCAVDRFLVISRKWHCKAVPQVREEALKKAPMEERADTYEAIRASLRLLDDPFTRFLDPDRYAALKRGNAGTVTGVGLEVGFSNESGRNRMVVRQHPAFDSFTRYSYRKAIVESWSSRCWHADRPNCNRFRMICQRMRAVLLHT